MIPTAEQILCDPYFCVLVTEINHHVVNYYALLVSHEKIRLKKKVKFHVTSEPLHIITLITIEQ